MRQPRGEPEFVPPMLLQRVQALPEGPWQYEVKLVTQNTNWHIDAESVGRFPPYFHKLNVWIKVFGVDAREDDAYQARCIEPSLTPWLTIEDE